MKNLPLFYPNMAALGGENTFDPATLFDSDTGFIFDLSDASTVFQERSTPSTPSGNGDPIGTLLDLSGNDNHIAAPSDETRPNYVTDGSVGYADFDPINTERLTAAFTLNQPATFIISVRTTSEVLNRPFMDGGVTFTNVFVTETGPVLRFYGNSGLGTNQSFNHNENIVATAIANGASSKVSVNSTAYTEGNAGTTNAGGVTFGSYADGADPMFMRLYRAIGIGRVLTDAEIANARAWCAT